VDTSTAIDNSLALTAHCGPLMWHRRCGHLNMQSHEAQHNHGVPSIPALPGSVKTVTCTFLLLHKASDAPLNPYACQEPTRPLTNLSSDTWGPVNVPSPHGLRYCLLVIDHHTNYMWVRFLRSKDDACPQFESILLEIRHVHARHHSCSRAFAPILKFDSDSVFEATAIRLMCGWFDVCVQHVAPYAHYMLGRAERPWHTLRDNASALRHNMSVPNSLWSCAISTAVYLRNRTFSRTVGVSGGVPLTLLTSKEPDASKFCVFGCIVFAKVPDKL
jgi:hypothetical protein